MEQNHKLFYSKIKFTNAIFWQIVFTPFGWFGCNHIDLYQLELILIQIYLPDPNATFEGELVVSQKQLLIYQICIYGLKNRGKHYRLWCIRCTSLATTLIQLFKLVQIQHIWEGRHQKKNELSRNGTTNLVIIKSASLRILDSTKVCNQLRLTIMIEDQQVFNLDLQQEAFVLE